MSKASSTNAAVGCVILVLLPLFIWVAKTMVVYDVENIARFAGKAVVVTGIVPWIVGAILGWNVLIPATVAVWLLTYIL